MKKRTNPIRYIVAGIMLLALTAVAHAQAVADPVTTATTSVNGALSLFTQCGPIWGGMLIVYGGVSWFLAQNNSTHWIAQGRALAAIVAALGVFASVLNAHFGNGDWTGVIAVFATAVFKLVSPTAPSSPSLAKAAQGGFVSRPLMTFISVLALAGVACWSTIKKDAGTVVTDVIDCAKAEGSAATAGTSVVAIAIDVGGALATIASGGDSAALEALIVKYGAPIVACSVAAIEAKHPAPTTGSGSASTAQPDRLGVAARETILVHGWKFKPAGSP